jgi:hypothetical protein
MILVKADNNTEAGVIPDEKLFVEMNKYNEELVRAGVMQAGEGLHPSSNGARIVFAGGKSTVIDGPFSPAQELVAGFWIFNVKSREEAIDWARRAPMESGTVLEVRRIYEAEDFGDALPVEVRDAEERMRAQLAAEK